MRLVDANTHKVREFIDDDNIPKFAILSHTWGAEEITLQQLQDAYGTARERAGFVKISLSCEQALRDGLDWVWIDTCCIDKTSTAELSEAINSMFRWYRMATTCYAYLSDVGSLRDLPHSRWFRRGWTLQELVAPRKIHFYGANWVLLGSKATLCAQLSISSGIEELVLRSGQFEHVSIARKMSWAARRQTTRVEDQAYCLLGIFDVNMPLLYGEGKKAFTRLQEEIMKTSDDQSLFAWGLTDKPRTMHQFLDGCVPEEVQNLHGLFADSPSDFTFSHAISVLENPHPVIPPIFSNKGVRIELQVAKMENKSIQFAALFCTVENHYDSYLGFPLKRWGSWGSQWTMRVTELLLIPARVLADGENPYRHPSVCLIKEPSLYLTQQIVTNELRIVRRKDGFEDTYHLEHVACAAHATYAQGYITLSADLDELHTVLIYSPERTDAQYSALLDGVTNGLWNKFWGSSIIARKAHSCGVDVVRPGFNRPKHSITQPDFAILVGGTIESPWVGCVTLLGDSDADSSFQRLVEAGEKASLAQFAATRAQLIATLNRNERNSLTGRRTQRLIQAIASYRGVYAEYTQENPSWIKKDEVLFIDAAIKSVRSSLVERGLGLFVEFGWDRTRLDQPIQDIGWWLF